MYSGPNFYFKGLKFVVDKLYCVWEQKALITTSGQFRKTALDMKKF